MICWNYSCCVLLSHLLLIWSSHHPKKDRHVSASLSNCLYSLDQRMRYCNCSADRSICRFVRRLEKRNLVHKVASRNKRKKCGKYLIHSYCSSCWSNLLTFLVPRTPKRRSKSPASQWFTRRRHYYGRVWHEHSCRWLLLLGSVANLWWVCHDWRIGRAEKGHTFNLQHKKAGA